MKATDMLSNENIVFKQFTNYIINVAWQMSSADTKEVELTMQNAK